MGFSLPPQQQAARWIAASFPPQLQEKHPVLQIMYVAAVEVYSLLKRGINTMDFEHLQVSNSVYLE